MYISVILESHSKLLIKLPAISRLIAIECRPSVGYMCVCMYTHAWISFSHAGDPITLLFLQFQYVCVCVCVCVCAA